METVNVVDFSQMKDLKELLEEKLSKLQDEITAQEIENVLTQFLKKELDEDTKEFIENLPEELFQKIFKRIKSTIKSTTKVIQNALVVNDTSTTPIECGVTYKEDEKDEALEKKNNEKVTALKKLITKLIEQYEERKKKTNSEIENCMDELSLNADKEPQIFIKKNGTDGDNKPVILNSKDVIHFMVMNQEDEAHKKIKETLDSYDKTNLLHQKIVEQYNELEERFLEQQKCIEFMKCNNDGELFLMKNGILY